MGKVKCKGWVRNGSFEVGGGKVPKLIELDLGIGIGIGIGIGGCRYRYRYRSVR